MALSKSFNKAVHTTYIYDTIDGHRKVVGKIDPETGEIVPTGHKGRPAGRKNTGKKPDQENAGPRQPVQSSIENSYKSLYESALRTIRRQDEEIERLKKQLGILNTFDLASLKTLVKAIEDFQTTKQADHL